MIRFKGSITTENNVEIPVIVTLNANSALNKEHHPVFLFKDRTVIVTEIVIVGINCQFVDYFVGNIQHTYI